MRVETQEQLCIDKNNYLAFEAGNYSYAISIEHIKKIAAMGEDTPYVIPPKAPEHVKCIIKLDGKLLTVIELLKNTNDILKEKNQIIVLNYRDKDIGIMAHNIHLINVSVPEISLDKIIRGKKLVYDEEGKIYLVFDISQCDKYVDV